MKEKRQLEITTFALQRKVVACLKNGKFSLLKWNVRCELIRILSIDQIYWQDPDSSKWGIPQRTFLWKAWDVNPIKSLQSLLTQTAHVDTIVSFSRKFHLSRRQVLMDKSRNEYYYSFLMPPWVSNYLLPSTTKKNFCTEYIHYLFNIYIYGSNFIK